MHYVVYVLYMYTHILYTFILVKHFRLTSNILNILALQKKFDLTINYTFRPYSCGLKSACMNSVDTPTDHNEVKHKRAAMDTV